MSWIANLSDAAAFPDSMRGRPITGNSADRLPDNEQARLTSGRAGTDETSVRGCVLPDSAEGGTRSTALTGTEDLQ